MKRKIIISGGGIGGLTAAKLLYQQGHQVTVLERNSTFNKSGFLISLKSFGISIMDELGLTAQLRKASSPSAYVNFRESNNEIIRGISYEKMNEHIERSILITRGGLHHVLYEDVKENIDIRFSSSIEKLEKNECGIKITLKGGKEIEADLLIISEGLRSPTRQKYFSESVLVDFNVLYMGGRLKEHHGREVGRFDIYIDVNKMLSIYPIAHDEIAIQCYINYQGDLNSMRDNAKELLSTSFQNYNQDIQHILNRFMANGTMFMDKMGMVEAPNLVEGNVVLLGDAGYCPTALSGMGASLSIYGAKALSHFINETPNDLKKALDNYNSIMQPIIRKFQGNAKNNAASFIPSEQESLKRFVKSFRAASDVEMQQVMTAPIVLTADQITFKVS